MMRLLLISVYKFCHITSDISIVDFSLQFMSSPVMCLLFISVYKFCHQTCTFGICMSLCLHLNFGSFVLFTVISILQSWCWLWLQTVSSMCMWKDLLSQRWLCLPYLYIISMSLPACEWLKLMTLWFEWVQL